eukprot:CAMPEP_0181180792 /NCGR_PEP_ID=MMETSP1096-20121128/6989_1 /TAXON_ID=156174 ORGANISM="Chrysochromulina ericina, Strain CCMP281" /NCGR_SAMPLE_ID=MMETSP1096 /ASSEMBLY_ACC=CAM_ASM_000453 /LENGTH=455 /DNA_ID=CAMNT_0023269245 /DNA_START=86 /DNA_END=1453 /DNA_ORIENTATION=+
MTDGRAWMQLVRIYKSTRDFDQAEATLRQAIEACPDNARLRQALADLCREQRRYNEAREHFRRAMLLDPQMSSVYDSWGRMEMQLGRHPVAVSLIKRGLALKPSARLYHALGVMLDTQGRAGQAREMLRTGLKLPNEEGNPQLLHALGMVEVRAGDLPRARQAFLSAIASNPSFTMAHLSLGQLEEKLGNYEGARRYYSAGATSPQPAARGVPAGRRGAVQLWQSWARMEQRLGSPSAALRLYERAVRFYSTDEQLLIEWSKLLTEDGARDATNWDKARTILQRVTGRRRPRPYAFQCFAALEQQAGNIAQARELYERGASVRATGVAVQQEMVPLLHAWAVFEWKSGEKSAARKLFERAEAVSPKPCGWLYQWHARFEADQGNVVLARHYYARAVNTAQKDSSVWRMWAEMEQGVGNAERASTYMRRSVELETEAWMYGDEERLASPLRRKGLR